MRISDLCGRQTLASAMRVLMLSIAISVYLKHSALRLSDPTSERMAAEGCHVVPKDEPCGRDR